MRLKRYTTQFHLRADHLVTFVSTSVSARIIWLSSGEGAPTVERSTGATVMPMAPPLQLTFVRSATLVSQLPPTPAEVAFVGRSNVGKSSLINALAHQRQLAQVSNTPGRTRLLNLFSLPNGRTVMDLPGYGYAKVNKAAKDTWGPMIEAYLLEREELRMVAVLVDGAIGPTKLDVQMLEWLRFHEVPHTVVATKHDQVGPPARPPPGRGCGGLPARTG